MERNINYTVNLSEIHPKSPQFAGIQGEHNATAINISFSNEFYVSLQKQAQTCDYIRFRIDYTDSLGETVYGEIKDINRISEPFYLTRVMTKAGGNANAVLKITCFDDKGTQKEFFTGAMRFYFESCPGVVLSDDETGSTLSPMVNQARIYRNEAYDCAKVAMETEENIMSIAAENRALKEQTQNYTQTALEASQRAVEIEGKIDAAKTTLSECEEAANLAKDAASGVVTIEQNRQIPLKISVMSREEYAAATRPSPDGNATLDLIEDEILADYIYPVGSIYMSVNSVDPSNLFGGRWERIKDRFLLSCGDVYTANSTGGEAKHTLTTEEMPSHKHNITYEGDYVLTSVGEIQRSSGIATGGSLDNVLTNKEMVTRTRSDTYTVGGNLPHNNMPPYFAVYMWKRIG